ncbi:plasminogen receptor (KT) isoform X1 [Tribolium castaneum]|uniref:Plasminogen receptor (KT)-like Protein n=1 Tax=Tribolium castaneum TaxID=7070 RepID=D6W8B5_TRICA|nr:PREDICTED: plasminogen receptor (KT) isoform X1 [Tribolium castaneum]EFA10888.2 Plasminogen receptor (KT)-like Protein [Tribolium castaneum]|eukprot:XP_969285.1 PREDICTED: plasminogen receptor (KT) isoform X1 [Tribolium castaneum]
MGNYFTVNMEENFKRNQDFITEMNTIKIERQVQIRKQMRDRLVALEIAKARELFFWYGSFYLLSLAGAIVGYRSLPYKRKLISLLPMVPLTFVVAYQADLAYGNKIHRILVEAEHIMQFEQELLALPLGIPTAASIDLGRMQKDESKKLHPLLPQT